jgi:hypothetical protein
MFGRRDFYDFTARMCLGIKSRLALHLKQLMLRPLIPRNWPDYSMRPLQYIPCITGLIPLSVVADHSNNRSCLNSTEARRIIDTWLPLNVQPPSAWLKNSYYNDTAMTLLALDFQLYSDSDNYVGSPPPDNPVRL